MTSKFKIQNLLFRDYSKAEFRTSQNGFTLLELTVVIGVFLVIGTIIVSILNSTFQGNSKVRISNDIAQNGNYALNIITNLLVNSQQFESISDGTTITTFCPTTGINGKSINVVGFDGGVTTILCGDSGANPTYNLSSNSASLIDSSQVILSSDSCTFTCTQADEFSPPRIDVVFTLKNVSADLPENTGNATFRTSVSLRNQDLK